MPQGGSSDNQSWYPLWWNANHISDASVCTQRQMRKDAKFRPMFTNQTDKEKKNKTKIFFKPSFKQMAWLYFFPLFFIFTRCKKKRPPSQCVSACCSDLWGFCVLVDKSITPLLPHTNTHAHTSRHTHACTHRHTNTHQLL